MQLEMSNVESLNVLQNCKRTNEIVHIISHAPFDLFEQTISAHLVQFIGYAPTLMFNTFGDVSLPLISFAEMNEPTKLVYIFNWADVSPNFEMNSRGHQVTEIISKEDIIEKINKHFMIIENVRNNSQINLVLFIPDINETYFALGHILERNQINEIYCHLLHALNSGSIIFEFKLGKQNFSNYFKYRIYDDTKNIVGITQSIAKNLFPHDYKLKVIFVDLDETVWPSNIGDWEKLPEISETSNKTFHYFQILLKKLSANGILLVAISKNDEHYVLKNFDRIVMPLRMEDFYSISCSWLPKSERIKNFINKINVLPEHCLFLDDNPVELLEVSSEVPNLRSILFSRNISDFTVLLSYLQSQLTSRSSVRENKARRIRRPTVSGTASKGYLRELELTIELRSIPNLHGRPQELINKTNQFNLNGIRRSVFELGEVERAFVADLKDIHGDFGTVGVLVFSEHSERITVTSFVLSCRAFSRGVELAMLNFLRQSFSEKKINFDYEMTDRNKVIGELISHITCGDNELDDSVLDERFKEYQGVISVL